MAVVAPPGAVATALRHVRYQKQARSASDTRPHRAVPVAGAHRARSLTCILTTDNDAALPGTLKWSLLNTYDAPRRLKPKGPIYSKSGQSEPNFAAPSTMAPKRRPHGPAWRKSPRLKGAPRFAGRLRCPCCTALKRADAQPCARFPTDIQNQCCRQLLPIDGYGPWQRAIAICDISTDCCPRFLLMCLILGSELVTCDLAVIERKLTSSPPLRTRGSARRREVV